ncbi:MAG: ABC transporter ATP-binding protein [Clostridiales bacterium]|nr:ABC transporter ATP-binding protein [Clostridiales bacterium]
MIQMENVNKSFFMGGGEELAILRGIDLNVAAGEFVAIVGPSGSGKTTLMNLIGCLDRPTSGFYALEGVDVGGLNDNELSDIRNQKIGFVFQNFNLMPRSSALQNVALPMIYAGVARSCALAKAAELLDLVGMSDRANHRPSELSGGQKQRVAIARALANEPAIILADEPTGQLDSATGRMIMEIFRKLHKQQNKTIVLITHNKNLSSKATRLVALHDGEIVDRR